MTHKAIISSPKVFSIKILILKKHLKSFTNKNLFVFNIGISISIVATVEVVIVHVEMVHVEM